MQTTAGCNRSKVQAAEFESGIETLGNFSGTLWQFERRSKVGLLELELQVLYFNSASPLIRDLQKKHNEVGFVFVYIFNG
jgi:hypothetical protein